MKEHPQAEILRAIADGKTIEMRRKNTLDTPDADNDWWVSNIVLQYLDDANREFRIKPDTININGHEVPQPVRESLEDGDIYWMPDINYTIKRYSLECRWDGDSTDFARMELGLSTRQKPPPSHTQSHC